MHNLSTLAHPYMAKATGQKPRTYSTWEAMEAKATAWAETLAVPVALYQHFTGSGWNLVRFVGMTEKARVLAEVELWRAERVRLSEAESEDGPGVSSGEWQDSDDRAAELLERLADAVRGES